MLRAVKDLAVAESVRAARGRAGKSQQSLATEAGISLRTLSRIEGGETTTIDTLARIAAALGMTSSELLAEPAGVAL
jgi:transcriptional regulator with XRE-family HTH domain